MGLEQRWFYNDRDFKNVKLCSINGIVIRACLSTEFSIVLDFNGLASISLMGAPTADPAVASSALRISGAPTSQRRARLK